MSKTTQMKGTEMTKSIFSLKAEVNNINRKIAWLHEIEADRADIDELIHERTAIQWLIVDAIATAK
jgi:hypothetical protein